MIYQIRHTGIEVSRCVFVDGASSVGGVQCSREQTGSGMAWSIEKGRGAQQWNKKASHRSPVTIASSARRVLKCQTNKQNSFQIISSFLLIRVFQGALILPQLSPDWSVALNITSESG